MILVLLLFPAIQTHQEGLDWIREGGRRLMSVNVVVGDIFGVVLLTRDVELDDEE